jgi:beta-lactamase class A
MNWLQAVESVAAAFSGTLGVWAKSLDTGEILDYRAQESFPPASTIKVPILYEVFRQAGEGRFSLTDSLTLQADDVVGGSGILQSLTPGLTLSVRDVATLMIIISDNTATNMLIDLVGMDAVNGSCERLGLTSTRLENKMQRPKEGERPKEGGPLNRSTPADLGHLVTLIAERRVLTPDACDAMLGIMSRQHFTDNITRALPEFDAYLEAGKEPTVRVASKSGSIRGTRNDVGLVEAHGRRYVIAMMSRGCTDLRFYHDNEASVLLPKVSAAVYLYFTSSVHRSRPSR